MNILLPQTVNLKADQFKPDIMKLIEETWTILDGTLYEISPGFWFDGMSMPSIFWSVYGHPFSIELIIQVLWHDLFYATQLFDQARCDAILKAMNRQRNKDWAEAYKQHPEKFKRQISLSSFRIHSISLGLKIGGKTAYESKTDAQIVGASKHLFIDGVPFNPGLIMKVA